jgi:hypothetical protein
MVGVAGICAMSKDTIAWQTRLVFNDKSLAPQEKMLLALQIT